MELWKDSSLKLIVKRFQSCVMLYVMEMWQVNLDWEHQVKFLLKRFLSGDWQYEQTM